MSGLAFYNVFLRACSLGIRFGFILFLAKKNAAEVVALYGLISAIIAYGTLVIGLEFHNVANKEYLISSSKKFNVLGTAFRFYAVLQLIFWPLFLPIFIFEVIPWKYAPYFWFLTVSEHFSQEITRVLIVTSRQIQATYTLFLRTGFWCLIGIIYLYFDAGTNPTTSLERLLQIWCVGSAFSVAYGVLIIKNDLKPLDQHRINFSFVYSKLPTAFSMLVVSASVQAFFMLDRFFLGTFKNLDFLAAYTLFVTAGLSVITFVDAGVIAFYISKVIKAMTGDKSESFYKTIKKFSLSVFIVSAFFSISVYLFVNVVVYFLDNVVYKNNIFILKWVVVSAFLFCLSNIPHTLLYAANFEKFIMRSHFPPLVFFILCGFSSVILETPEIIPVALTISMLIMLMLKIFFVIRLNILTPMR